MSELLKDMQLHIFPSRSEGFPKVILETACAGVPSLVYADYGQMKEAEIHFKKAILASRNSLISIRACTPSKLSPDTST